MGRNKLNRTTKELNELNNKRRMRSYWKHRDEECWKARERYKSKTIPTSGNIQDNEQS